MLILGMNTLYPVRIKTGNKFRYGFYLWSETWKDTDDFFFIWERNTFKPYYRNKIYVYQNGKWVDVYPEYHYKVGKFEEELQQFVNSLSLEPVVMQGKRVYLIHWFEDEGYNEFWAFDINDNQEYYSFTIPRKSHVQEYDLVSIRQLLYDYLVTHITERIKFADIHLNHLMIVKRDRK